MNGHTRPQGQEGERASIGGLAEAIYSLRDDVKDIKDNLMPRDEIASRLAAITERVIRIENNPQLLRAWIAVLVSSFGCLGTLVLGMASIGVSIWIATHR